MSDMTTVAGRVLGAQWSELLLHPFLGLLELTQRLGEEGVKRLSQLLKL